jgi:hypothetical protein
MKFGTTLLLFLHLAGIALRAQTPDSAGGVDAARFVSAIPEAVDGEEAAFDSASGRQPRRKPAVSSSDLCTAPLPGVAVPNAPHGIFALDYNGATAFGLSAIVHQPAVCGGIPFIVWSTVDKGNGQYDWSSVDTNIAYWTAAGKTVNLLVWDVSNNAPNTGTPAYVLADKNYKSVSCVDQGITSSWPVYYLDPFKSYYKTFMQAVLNRYGANPNVGYIRFGLGKGAETFPTCMSAMMTYSGFTQQQFDAQWESYNAEMTQYLQGVQAQIRQSSGRVVEIMTSMNGVGTSSSYAVNDFQAKDAASKGMGFGCQGESQSDITNYQNGKACVSDWCAMFKMYAGQAPLQLSTLAASDPTNAPGGTGSMTALLPFALSLHTQIFEAYISDLLIAYDPTNKDYAQYGAAYRQAFEQFADTVGYGSKP